MAMGVKKNPPLSEEVEFDAVDLEKQFLFGLVAGSLPNLKSIPQSAIPFTNHWLA